MDSFYCGKNTWSNFRYLRCFSWVNWSCDHVTKYGAAGNIKNIDVGSIKNKSEILEIGPYYPEAMGAVTVFDRSDCSGLPSRFYWNPVDPDGGQYIITDFQYAEHLNDSASSLMVPRGYTAILYRSSAFENEIGRFEGGYDSFLSEQMDC